MPQAGEDLTRSQALIFNRLTKEQFIRASKVGFCDAHLSSLFNSSRAFHIFTQGAHLPVAGRIAR